MIVGGGGRKLNSFNSFKAEEGEEVKEEEEEEGGREGERWGVTPGRRQIFQQTRFGKTRSRARKREAICSYFFFFLQACEYICLHTSIEESDHGTGHYACTYHGLSGLNTLEKLLKKPHQRLVVTRAENLK